MSQEIMLRKNQALDFESFHDLFEIMSKTVFPGVDQDKLEFSVDVEFSVETVDNSFDHEFGTEVLHELKVNENSMQIYVYMFENGVRETRVELKLKPSQFLNVSEYSEILNLCNRHVDMNVSRLLEV